jgi:hypothetical protein
MELWPDMTLSFDTDEFLAAIQRAVGERIFEIAEDARRDMGVDGNLITIRRNLNPDHSGDSINLLEIEVPAGHDALLLRFRENLFARARH